jgi:hypothetical protein
LRNIPGREHAVHLYAVAGFHLRRLNHFDRMFVNIPAILAEQHLIVKVLIAGAAVAVAQLGAAQGGPICTVTLPTLASDIVILPLRGRYRVC